MMNATKDPSAYAKIATKGDTIPPFFIDDKYVKEVDESGTPKKIEVVLGRSPQPGGPITMFDADFHIGNRMKISKRHAMIYWNADKQMFEIKSICKNAVKVNGASFAGSQDGNNGQPAPLTSQACIQIADGTPLYFLLPKGRAPALEKPKATYEQLIMSVLEPDKELTFTDIIQQIQQKFPYYSDDSMGENHPWKGSLRTTLGIKTKAFEKTTRQDAETGKKTTYWSLKKDGDDGEGGDGMGVGVSDEEGDEGDDGEGDVEEEEGDSVMSHGMEGEFRTSNNGSAA